MVLVRHGFILSQAVRQVATGSRGLTVGARRTPRELLVHRIAQLVSTATVTRWTKATSGLLFFSRGLCVTPPAKCPAGQDLLINYRTSIFDTASMDKGEGPASGQGSTDHPANSASDNKVVDSSTTGTEQQAPAFSNTDQTDSAASAEKGSDADSKSGTEGAESNSTSGEDSKCPPANDATSTEPGHSGAQIDPGRGDKPLTADLNNDSSKGGLQSSPEAATQLSAEQQQNASSQDDHSQNTQSESETQEVAEQNKTTPSLSSEGEHQKTDSIPQKDKGSVPNREMRQISQNTNPFEENTNPFEENTTPSEENTNPFEESSENTNPFESDPGAIPSACPFSGLPLGGQTQPNDDLPATKDTDRVRAGQDVAGLQNKMVSPVQNQSGIRTQGERDTKANSLKSSVATISTGQDDHGQRNGNGLSAAPSGLTSSGREVSKEVVDTEGDVVLVTGGNGFLGQHIVKMLQTRAPHVGQIWVLDLKPFEQKLEYSATKPVRTLVGDIADEKFVAGALKGVNSVIHVAGLASWGTFPDFEGMERVNVRGTLNIYNSCIKNNVERLIYCSTVDVVVGHQPILGGTERNTPVPDKFLFPGYPETKYHGERIVLGSTREKRTDGTKLRTVILRANVLYGELDTVFVPNAIRQARQSKGILHQIGDGKAMFQQAYVGNAAWAFVCADRAMRENPSLSEEIFYIPDHTPIQNLFNFMRPYVEAHGFKLSEGYMSYPLWHSAITAAEYVVKGLSPLKKISLPTQSCTIAYINTDLYFIGTKAHEVLKFDPIYSPLEARALSMKYYQSLVLEDKGD